MSLSRLRWHRHVLWALSVTYPAALLAQEPAPPAPDAAAVPDDPEKRKEEAKVRFQRGLELVQNESWDAALAEFLASRKLFPTRVALKNAALSLRQLKRYVEALAMYNELLTQFATTIPPEERKTIDDAVTQLKQTVGEVQVNSDQPGSTVVIDGQQLPGVTPLAAIGVNAGTHTVRISKEGYEAVQAQVLVAGGQRETVNGKLKALSTVGRLVVNEAGGKTLDVVVDGAVVGKTPRYEGVLAVGAHTVFLKGEGNLGTAPSQASVKENQAATLTLSAVELDAEIRIEPVPANASVFVDSVQIGNGVWEGRLQSGAHEIEIAGEGFIAYRKTANLTKGKKELVKVRLERDLSNPMWSAGFVPHLYAEVFGGAMLAPIGGFGGGADKACGNGDCTSKQFPLGFLAGARGGYQFIKGFSGEIGFGFLYMGEKLRRKNVIATQEQKGQTLTGTNYKDQTTLAGPFVELSAAYQMLDKTPLTFRLGGGVARAKASFKNGGTVTGDVQHVCNGEPGCDDTETTSVNEFLKVGEQAPFIIVPFVAPEVRMGYRLAKKVVVDFGITLFLMIPPPTEREPSSGGGSFELPNNQGRKIALPAYNYQTNPTTQNGPVVTLPHDKGFGVVLALVPSLSGHFDF
ncbi:MAG TPA: PEGA domain-containing protein [Polyangiaceae bacterium]|nr:PEGA domain-containing protein [Polyangiaceae bacterium]